MTGQIFSSELFHCYCWCGCHYSLSYSRCNWCINSTTLAKQAMVPSVGMLSDCTWHSTWTGRCGTAVWPIGMTPGFLVVRDTLIWYKCKISYYGVKHFIWSPVHCAVLWCSMQSQIYSKYVFLILPPQKCISCVYITVCHWEHINWSELRQWQGKSQNGTEDLVLVLSNLFRDKVCFTEDSQHTVATSEQETV